MYLKQVSIQLLAMVLLLLASACQNRLFVVDDALVNNPQDPSIVSGTLPNGFRYLLRSGNSAARQDQIDIRLVVGAGSLDEAGAEQGYAHLLEHMVFRGTKNFPASRIESFINRYGLQWGREVNATTTYGSTVFRFLLSTDESDIIPELMSLFSEFLSAVNFDENNLALEKKIVAAERLYRFGKADTLVNPVVAKAIRGSAFASRPPIGRSDTLQRATVERVKAFWRRHYTASNAALVVVGDILPWELEPKIAKRFGGLATVAATRPPIVAVKTDFSQQTAVYVDPAVNTAQVALNFVSPQRLRVTGDARFIEALVFNTMSTRISQRLRATSCSRADLNTQYHESGQSIFSISVPVAKTEFVRCMAALANVYRTVAASPLLPVEYQLLQSRFRQLAIDEADRYRTAGIRQIADQLTKTFTNGVSVLPSALYASQLLELVDGMDVHEFNRLSAEHAQSYQLILSATDDSDLYLPSDTALNNAFAKRDLVMRQIAQPVIPRLTRIDAEMQTNPAPLTVVRDNNEMTEWRLANGARVFFIEDTHYDSIAVAATASGGYQLKDPHLQRAAAELPDLLQHEVIENTFRQSSAHVESSLFTTPTSHGLRAFAPASHIDALFDEINGYFGELSMGGALGPSSDSAISHPLAVKNYWSERLAYSSGSVIVEAQHFEQAYQRLFGSPSEFVVVIVGNAHSSEITPLLAGLNSVTQGNRPGASVIPPLKSVNTTYSIAEQNGSSGVEITLFHECQLNPDNIEADEFNLQVLSHALQRRLTTELRERHGLSYELESHLLKGQSSQESRIHKIAYTVNTMDVGRARQLVQDVLESVAESGLHPSELEHAIVREQKRRRSQSHDYLATAAELAASVLGGGNISDRFATEFSMQRMHALASCFMPGSEL